MRAIRTTSVFSRLGKRALPLVRSPQIGRRTLHSTVRPSNSRGSYFAYGLAGATLLSAYLASKAYAHAEEKETTPQEEIQTVADQKLKHKYVIIGGGTAGHSALVAILQNDPEAKVLVISSEPYLPYTRPPLTKDLWNSGDPDVSVNLKFKNWEGVESSVWYEGVDYKNDPRVLYMTNQKVIDIDPYLKAILLQDGQLVEYEKCLIATGGDPRILPSTDVPHVSTFRTLDDFRQIDQVSRVAKNIVVIGGGFLGSELAWGISKKGVKVTQVFPEDGVLAASLPSYLSEYATNIGRNAGIEMYTGRFIDSIIPSQNEEPGVIVRLDNGQSLTADHVVVAAGIIPSNQLAKVGDLEIDPNNGGILVNSELVVRTDLYAAGDVASYYDPVLNTRRRVEHHDHAIASGKLAGRNMTGKREAYGYQPFFWSDIGPIGFEAVGVVDSKLPTVAVWQKPEGEGEAPANPPEYKRGIIYYLKDEIVVGVLLLGVYGKVDVARFIIQTKHKIQSREELIRSISLEEEHH